METARARAPFGRLFSLGFSVAIREPALWLLGASSRLIGSALWLGLVAAGGALALHAADDAAQKYFGVGAIAASAASSFMGRYALPLAGAAVTAGLLALMLEALYVACAVQRAARRARDPADAGSTLAAGAPYVAGPVKVLALLLPLRCAQALYGWAAVGAAGVAYLSAVGRGGGGVAASFALALAVLLALGLWAYVEMVGDLALVRSVAAGQGATASVADAARLIARRPWTTAGLFVAFMVVPLAVSVGSGMFGAMFVGAEGRFARAIEVALAMVVPMLAGLATAALDVARWASLTGLVLDDRGDLPAPPAPAPEKAERVFETELVLDTELVSEPGPVAP